MDRRVLVIALAASLVSAFVLVACGEEEPAGPEVDNTPIVGLFEMPISRNNQATEPQNALRLDISPTLMRLNGTKVLDLDNGRPAEGEVADHIVTKLRDQITGGAARERTALTIHASVPYSTLAQVLNTLQSTNMRQVAFAVRTLGESPQQGWMPLTNWRVAPTADDVEFEGRAPTWSAFTEHWREVYDACRAGRYIDCDGPYSSVAEGGDLGMELWTRGQGMKVTFRQANAPEPEEGGGGGGPALIEGVGAPTPAPSGEEAEPPPATQGVFTVRHQEATQEESALSNMVAPVCADATCFATVVTDAGTASMRVLSMLGGVFPNGTQAPQLVFVLPE